MVGGCRKAGFRVQSLVLLGSGGDGRGVGSTQLDDGRQSVVPFGVIVGTRQPKLQVWFTGSASLFGTGTLLNRGGA